MSGWNGLAPQHVHYLETRAVSPEVAEARGYRSITHKTELEKLGFGSAQRRVPSLAIPIWAPWATNEPVVFQAHPDDPRRDAEGKALKFEYPSRAKMRLDVHPSKRQAISNPELPLLIVEGVVKADAGVSHLDVCTVGLAGVWTWRGRNDDDGLCALADWEHVALNDRDIIVVFDSDVMLKTGVYGALVRLGHFLKRRGQSGVHYAYLPSGPEGRSLGLDDWIAARLPAESSQLIGELVSLCEDHPRGEQGPVPVAYEAPARRELAEVEAIVSEHLLLKSMDPLYSVLGTYAGNRLPGSDPVWLGLVGGSSQAKTELVQAIRRSEYVHLSSQVSGEQALLSGTSSKERAADATGGILREIGDFGIWALKDFTTILSMHRDARAKFLAALREIHDGAWSREIGVDGARRLDWSGKVGLIFGVTTKIDTAHEVIAEMGERFVFCRVPPADPSLSAEKARSKASDSDWRGSLAEAVAGFLASLDYSKRPACSEELGRLIDFLSAFVVQARSPVEWDYKGTAIELVHDLEGTGRLDKALDQLRAGLEVIGLDEATVRKVLTKVGMDSMPKGRRQVLDRLSEAWQSTKSLAMVTGLPTKTTWRRLSELTAHGMAERQAGADLKEEDDSYDGRGDYWRKSEVARRWLAEVHAGDVIPPETPSTTTSNPLYKSPDHERDISGLNIPPPQDEPDDPWVTEEF